MNGTCIKIKEILHDLRGACFAQELARISEI